MESVDIEPRLLPWMNLPVICTAFIAKTLTPLMYCIQFPVRVLLRWSSCFKTLVNKSQYKMFPDIYDFCSSIFHTHFFHIYSDSHFVLVAYFHGVKSFNLVCIETTALFLSVFIFHQNKYCTDYNNESKTSGDRHKGHLLHTQLKWWTQHGPGRFKGGLLGSESTGKGKMFIDLVN